jgi:hypothetical protein
MATTYEPIATTTLGTAASSITFSSIAATYTDLRLVFVGATASADAIYVRLNGDSASNYSDTSLEGNGTAASSQRLSNTTFWRLEGFWQANTSTTPFMQTLDIFSYAGSTYKTALGTSSNDKNGSGDVLRTVHLYRSTSAISSLLISTTGPNMTVGTTATLYGIKNA